MPWSTTLTRRRALLLDGLRGIPGFGSRAPSGAFYLYADVSELLERTGLTTDAFAARLLDDAGVATIAGTTFGDRGAGYLRLSFAGPDADLERGARWIRAFVDTLETAGKEVS